MKKSVVHLSFVCLSFIGFRGFSQYIECPESIVFDSIHHRYFISNSYNNTVCQADTLGIISNFIMYGLLNQPKGLIITGDTLYIANSGSVTAVKTDNAALVNMINIPGATSLTDIEKDDEGNLYLSDNLSHFIVKLSLQSQISTILFHDEYLKPSCLLFDHNTQNLLFCCSNDNKIRAINLATDSISTIASTFLSSPAGMAFDNCGFIYISDKLDNTVYVFDGAPGNPPTRFAEGLEGPADICINISDNVLAVPNILSGCIAFIQLQEGCGLPNLISPADNSIINTESVSLIWNDKGINDKYIIQITTDSTFYDAVEFETVDTTYVPCGLVSNERYYWRVRTSGGPGKDIYCPVWKFDYLPSENIDHRLADKEIVIFPDPATGLVYIYGTNDVIYLKISDISGRTVKISNIKEIVNNSVNISGLRAGVYIFSLITKDGSMINRKITVIN